MMKARVIEIPGEPIGKGRPRACLRKGMPTVYTPSKTVDYQAHVQECYKAQCGAEMIPKGVPICLTVDAIFGLPKSASKRAQEKMLSGEERPTKKPDADNILKIIADALNGLAWYDDAQITSAHLAKAYGKTPCVRVWISEED